MKYAKVVECIILHAYKWFYNWALELLHAKLFLAAFKSKSKLWLGTKERSV